MKFFNALAFFAGSISARSSGAPGYTPILQNLKPGGPHARLWATKEEFGPAHHHISFGYDESSGEVVFVNGDNDAKTFKGLLLRLTGAEFNGIPGGFKGYPHQSNYLTHSSPALKSTADVRFPISCNPGDSVKVEATMAIKINEFFFDLVGEFQC
ncbi:Oidioi.mRNA.OKI2018_I69.chr2.g8400.t1.cds [Oikopleura dioica]|uniref:Oidioi.mRNA.OKI2018_I69.chr2.g8400.t1.cds n=1 Tax=Oikopleura dioica TaxID=34765 RepID=A0ABN7TGU0_OIKDI|nr:Oidioi.mRNA.OKI2018_I69.chr2.g8400.t1.cds [Oikopleura dioica]